MLRDEIKNLGPWHMNYCIDGLPTAKMGGRTIGTHNPRQQVIEWKKHFAGCKSMLDLACNSGGYMFYAEKLYGLNATGVEARDHWRNQYLFLKEKLFPNTQSIFYQMDVMDLPQMEADIVICKGIFYHVLYPMQFLNYVGQATQKICIFNTATTHKKQDEGALYYNREGESLISGIHGHGYLPDGPKICEAMLKNVGFKRTVVTSYWNEPNNLPRLEIIAYKE